MDNCRISQFKKFAIKMTANDMELIKRGIAAVTSVQHDQLSRVYMVVTGGGCLVGGSVMSVAELFKMDD